MNWDWHLYVATQAVLDYFNSRMDESAGGDWSVERVLGMVTTMARSWRGDGIKLFTELRFTYEEEANPEEFFVPYVWSLVCAHSGIPWDPAAIALFEASDGFDQAGEDDGEFEDNLAESSRGRSGEHPRPH